ncbi:hypothetical protein DV515_00008950 [Chloebia gouldiae]|uniref:C2H2-type domain-containing protein n=1 Tax=Chloebia gouldiae TaxID=44316 RepID=A0A3L8SDX8_CHLGU|nr:hypothetical protein DV515_00008950 [Chloebia gouldiae]
MEILSPELKHLSSKQPSHISAPLAAEREKKPLSRAVFVLPWVESTETNNFRYTCDICGKKYKYYSCFQEHRDLHAVDDPYDQAVIAADEVKEEEPEPFQKIGPKTGNYTCEFCGKQYKYYTPYQEHVALHAPISEYCCRAGLLQAGTSRALGSTRLPGQISLLGILPLSCGVAVGRTQIMC